jgi:alpha-glucosidase (family GH31 glycosyl hydrolase)
LFPYIYSLAHEATRSGLPVIRAMFLAFPDDPNTYDKDLQYMLGPSLLVAPIYDDGEARSVYLPPGSWIDYWTGESFTGPANVRVSAPLDTLPLFVAGGSILPMTQVANRTPAGDADPLIIEVYPHGKSEYHFIEDSGETTFTFATVGDKAVLSWQGALSRPFSIRFKHFGRAVQPENKSHYVTQADDSSIVAIQDVQVGHCRVRLS